MQKRNTRQRRQLILEQTQKDGEVSVETLAREHDTSEVTIRKDLAALEEAGLVLRRYGGAVSLPPEALEEQTIDTLSAEKLSIAALAAELIKDHNRIVMDSGSTTRAMIPHMSRVQGLLVMTNSMAVANELLELENPPTLLMTGGTWDPRSESFQGLVAQKVLSEYNFDQLFIGADGLDPLRGTTTYNEFNELSKAMATVSREVIVVAESVKIDRKIPNLELSWSDVDILVTNDGMPEPEKNSIESYGVRVMCAKTK